MSRLTRTLAQVTSFAPGYDGEPWPLTFISHGSRFRVDLKHKQAERFLVLLQWWEEPNAVGKAPPEAEFYRLPLIGGGLVELAKEPDGQWMLWKSYD